MALVLVAMLATTAQQAAAIVPRAVLKQYFQRGDRPTESQFDSLIDSILTLPVDGLHITGLGVSGSSNNALRLENGSAINGSLNYLSGAQVEPLWAGQAGFLPLQITDTNGFLHYGYMQMHMDEVANAAALAEDLINTEPPAINVEYLVYEDQPNTSITATPVPEPTGAIAMVACACAMLARFRRR
jgi:hypothetical protein